jgi:MFS family permease
MILQVKQRLFLSTFFFISGFSFSSWASRIPTIKAFFQFNEAQMGTVLMAMPISSLIGLPISGWLVARYDSRIPLTVAFAFNALALASIGFADSAVALVASICAFSFSMRIFNISANTQAIALQKQFDRKIIGSFHGLWSTGGIAGVGVCTLMVAANVPMQVHLLGVAGLALGVTALSFAHLLRNDRTRSGNKLILGKPDPYILYLGLLIFFAAVCEGGMFDWSGIYFREVLNVRIFTYGYLAFMICMSIARFLSDRIIDRIGMPATYVVSSVLVMSGIGLAVGFPFFWTALAGFALAGFGTAPVVPMTYTLAGTSPKYSPGLAISIISTYSTVGMLLGPPVIGYLAHAVGLRQSFVAFALAGLVFIPMSRLFFQHQQKALKVPGPTS